MKIEISDMDFSYGDFAILHDINLCMDGPQLISIVGPNGVGKSTLVGCICGLFKIDKGSIKINGIQLEEYKSRDLARIVGYVPCTAKDSFPMSVTDTVLMGKGPYNGWRTTDADLRAVYAILDLLGIEDLAMRNFDELSAGQHQKVMLARGMIQDTEILILDEPTANLDIKHQLEVTRILSDLVSNRGMMIITISHDLNIASQYSDNIIMMHEGTILQVGRPDDVINCENLHRVYGVESEIVQRNGRPYVILDDPNYGTIERHSGTVSDH